MQYIIETSKIVRVFSRGRVRALDRVSLNVEPGQIFGLLGPNGAGKTTFIKILLSALRCTEGEAKLFAIPVADPKSRERVGYLPESHRFPEFLTGAAFLQYSAQLSGLTNKQVLSSRASSLLKKVKMWEWRNTRIKKYSKGMIQRLGLAQALLHDPELVFLDEPTDGVDPIGRKEIRDLLLNLKSQGKTIFLNSHLLSEVELICDEVAILDRGRLLKQSTVAALTTSSRRYEIHAADLTEEVLQKIKPMAESAVIENGRLNISVASTSALNQIIDSLRQQRLLIRAVMPHRQSLEEAFVQTITHSGTADLNEIFPRSAATDTGHTHA